MEKGHLVVGDTARRARVSGSHGLTAVGVIVAAPAGVRLCRSLSSQGLKAVSARQQQHGAHDRASHLLPRISHKKNIATYICMPFKCEQV